MCHPERSEGSEVFEKQRFFAALRKTLSEIFYFCLNLFFNFATTTPGTRLDTSPP
jgi:hypothetical protein